MPQEHGPGPSPGAAPGPGHGAGPPQDPQALIGAIDARAEEERSRLLLEAEESARRIRAEADAECARLTAEAMDELEQELAGEQQRLLGEARMAARAAGLQRRRALVDEAFDRAAQEVARRAAGPEGPAAIERLAREAREAVGEPCSLTRTPEGGVRAVSADGRRSVHNSLGGRQARARLIAEHEVARRLFTDAAP